PSANDGPSFTTSKTSQNTTSENVHFVDGDTPWTYDVAATPDETSKLSGFDDAGLGEFLSRPIKIQQYQWTPGVQLFQTFNPWSDYFGNADVLEKINRFRNLRCKLCLKVLINGNSFYYGRALLSYNPYLRNDQVTVNRSFFIQDLIAASNKPHILLDPCSSEGGQMCLPFIWPENYLDITSTGWEDQMGECIIHDFDVLRHANGGTDPITVSIFAWAEDVSLLIPTTVAAQ
nr:Chain B, VP2 [Chaetoceros tenuissimus RNA virus type II]